MRKKLTEDQELVASHMAATVAAFQCLAKYLEESGVPGRRTSKLDALIAVTTATLVLVSTRTS